MSDAHKDRRISTAASLIDQIAALEKVEVDKRRGFVHDQLMAAIDDICAMHKENGRQVLTKAQINVIKDVAFQIVYILDSNNQPPSSALQKFRFAFKRGSITEKIMLMAAVITIFVGILTMFDFVGRYAGAGSLFNTGSNSNAAGSETSPK